MGDLKGSGGTTASSEPWGPQRAPLQFGFDQARQIYDSGGPQFYPNATYVPFSPMSEQGLGMLQARAGGGSPVDRAAQGHVQGTLQGDFLNSNPWLDQTFQNASESLTPAINATFGQGSRTGSGLHALSMGKAQGQLAADIYGPNYQAERDRMMGATALTPSISGLDYTDITKMLGGGGMVEGKAGEVLDDSRGRFDWNQGLPNFNLNEYMKSIRGGFGSDVQSGPDITSGQQFAGGFGTGVGIGNQMGLPWWGQLLAGLGGGAVS